MIWVDPLRQRRAPWGGGMASHMVSDESIEELRAFASSLGIPLYWLQAYAGIEFFNLSPRQHAKAVADGAQGCTARELVDHYRRSRRRAEVVPAPAAPLDTASRGARPAVPRDLLP